MPASTIWLIQRSAVVAGTPAAMQSEVTETWQRSARAAERSRKMSHAGSAKSSPSKNRALACRLSESPILALFYLHDEGRDRMRRFVERGPGWDSGTEVRVRLEEPEGAPDGG